MNNNKSREAAYAEFQQLVEKETGNGAETLALFRLARSFSTASDEETKDTLTVMRYWSRKGDRDALLQHGGELYHGGYDPALYEPGGQLHTFRLKNAAATAGDTRYRHS